MMGRDPLLHPPLNFICEGGSGKCVIVASDMPEAVKYYEKLFPQNSKAIRVQQVTEAELYIAQQHFLIELDTFVAE